MTLMNLKSIIFLLSMQKTGFAVILSTNPAALFEVCGGDNASAACHGNCGMIGMQLPKN